MLTREQIAQFDNDALSCYDRILVSISSLASRKFGIHKDVIMFHSKTLKEAKFKLKTQKGVSSRGTPTVQHFRFTVQDKARETCQ